MFRPLLEAPTLRRMLAGSAPPPILIDCRFSLADPPAGRMRFRAGHIPGARYAHLDEDLSSPVVPGRTGRHPLPDLTAFARRLGSWGIRPGLHVVCYDDGPGAFASRLWWLLRYVGHDEIQVLNGGWSAWTAGGGPSQSSDPSGPSHSSDPSGPSHSSEDGGEPDVPKKEVGAAYPIRPRPGMLASAAEVAELATRTDHRIIDAREYRRWRGFEEPIDPVAGRIPRAANAPWVENVGSDGRLLDPNVLADGYLGVLDGVPPDHAVVYCGSGVTASHDLLAMEVAGLSGARLYAGSWSEWITDPSRPIERG